MKRRPPRTTPEEIITKELEWRYGQTGELDGALAIIAALNNAGFRIVGSSGDGFR